MTSRVEEHADVLVDWGARIERGDDVVVCMDEATHELCVAVAEKLGEVGANPCVVYDSDQVTGAFLRGHDGKFDGAPAHELELFDVADSVLMLRGGRNLAELSDVPASIKQRHDGAREPIVERKMDTDWMVTIHPTRALAQRAGMSYAAYRDFVYDSIFVDWEELAEEMERVKSLLDAGAQVRVTGPRTDLTFRIDGRTAVNSAASVVYDSHNLPSGEVFTAPYAVEGQVHFDVPITIDGGQIDGARLAFEDGTVVDWAAERGESVLTRLIETDEGSRRLGEFGIGMNPNIERPTSNIIFDEKMDRTVHFALGRAYDANLPDGETGNQSAVHADLITDMSRDSAMYVDGELVQKDGVFHWDDDFDGG